MQLLALRDDWGAIRYVNPTHIVEITKAYGDFTLIILVNNRILSIEKIEDVILKVNGAISGA